MLENTQNFRNDSGDENTLFKRAYVQGNLNGVKITAGRQFLSLVMASMRSLLISKH